MSEINIISYEDDNQTKQGIFNFENCAFRSASERIGPASCCSAAKIKGFSCSKKNKFPISFLSDCSSCEYFLNKNHSNATIDSNQNRK